MPEDATLLDRAVDAPPPSSYPADATGRADLLVGLRRHLHQHPELGFQEEDTARLIRRTLTHYGLDPVAIAETGTYVDIEGAHPGPAVGYRADIDALPIPDAKDAAYRSLRPGVAHLCGHDAHTAMGLGVALFLEQHRDRIPGTVRVFFQPNEEGMPSGAPRMIEGGVLQGLERVYAVHVDPTLDAGRYGLLTGPVTAAADRFDVVVRGRGTGHSARPHEAVDTVWVATQIANAFYQLVGRVTDPRNATVLTICRFEGGQAHNVIPAEVSFGGTLRTVSPEDRRFLRDKMEETASRLASLHGAEARLGMDHGAPAVVNAAEAVRTVEDVLKAVRGETAIHYMERPSMGAEDFAHYLQHVPGALVRVGSRSGPTTGYPLHDDRFDIDEGILEPTAALMSEALIRSLEQLAA